jgi:hypothetical protein
MGQVAANIPTSRYSLFFIRRSRTGAYRSDGLSRITL